MRAGKWMNFRWLLLTVVVIVGDQWSKAWAVDNFAMHTFTPVAEYFNWTLAHNPGAAFSFLANAGGWKHVFFTVIALVICSVLLVWLYRLPRTRRIAPLAISMVIAGAVGNLIDRLLQGYVVDFMDFHHPWLIRLLGTPHWPAFNVADMAICFGAFLFIVDAFKNPEVAASEQKNLPKKPY